MALFPNPGRTPLNEWPKEKQDAFQRYLECGGQAWFFSGAAEGWMKCGEGTFSNGFAFTDDPDAKTPAEYDQAYHGARITPEFRGKPPAEDATAPQPTGVANPDRVSLRQMGEADQLAILSALRSGEPVWRFIDGEWRDCQDEGSVYFYTPYTTIDPTKPIPEVQYPWEWLPDWVRCCGMHADGLFYAYSDDQPVKRATRWDCDGRYEQIPPIITINTYGLHWTKTLARRPALTSG